MSAKSRRRRKQAKAVKLYLMIIVISLVVSLIFLYLTGALPKFIDGVVKKRVDRAKDEAIKKMQEDIERERKAINK